MCLKIRIIIIDLCRVCGPNGWYLCSFFLPYYVLLQVNIIKYNETGVKEYPYI